MSSEDSESREAETDSTALPVDGTDVLAILVTRPDPSAPDSPTPDGLVALQSVLHQQPPPGIVVVAHVGRTPPAPLDVSAPETMLVQVHVPGAQNFGQAVAEALDEPAVKNIPGTMRVRWFWLVHDDMAAMPGALASMLTLGRTSGSIAAIGPKQVSYENPDRLLELGIQATASGRRIFDMQLDEIDQGQYDSRLDVLAVGTAGMLVRESAWRETGGLDDALGPFGDGLEFGRRLRRAGHRVAVAPQAKVLHRQRSHQVGEEAKGSFEARRVAQLYNWVVHEPLWRLPLLLLWLPLLTLSRVVARLATKEPRLALSEASAYLQLIGKTGAALRARRRLASVAAVPRSTVRQMDAGSTEVMRARRLKRRVANQKKLGGPVLDQGALAARRTYRIRSASALVAVLIVTALVAVFTWRSFNGGPIGALWGDLPSKWSTLAAQALSGWQVSGDGLAAPASAKLLPLTLLSAPFALFKVAPAQVAIWSSYLVLPLAVLSGWAAVSSFTRSIPLRVAGALVWGFALPLLFVLTRGDLPQALAYVALPWVVVGVWRGRGRSEQVRLLGVSDVTATPRPDYLAWFAAAGIALLFVAPAAPLLLLVTIIGGVGVALTGKRISWLGLTIATLPALVWVLPELVSRASWSTPQQFWVWFAGGVSAGADQGAWWEFLSGSPISPAALTAGLPWSLVSLAGGAATLVLALGAFLVVALRRHCLSTARFVGAGLALAGSLAAFAGAALVTQASGGGQVSPLLLGLALLLLLVALAAVSGEVKIASKASERRHVAGSAVFLRATGGALLSLASAASVAAVVVTGPLHGEPADSPDVAGPLDFVAADFAVRPVGDQGFPLIAAQSQESPRQARVLSLSKTSGTLEASLLRGRGVQLADLLLQSPYLAEENESAALEAERELALAAAVLASGIRGDGAELIAEHAIDIVLLSSGSENQGEIANILDATEGLERIGTIESGSMWRVRPEGTRPSRVTLVSGEKSPEVDSHVVEVDTELVVPAEAVLRLAEAKDQGWRATFDGTQLEQVEQDGWATEFLIPAGEGRLQIRYAPPYVPWWIAVSALLLVVLAVSAIPWRARPASLQAVAGLESAEEETSEAPETQETEEPEAEVVGSEVPDE